MREAECRACKATIIWTVTAAGRRMPVDAEPSSAGTFALEEDGDSINAIFSKNPNDAAAGLLHESHFATCIAADSFRKTKRSKWQRSRRRRP